MKTLESEKQSSQISVDELQTVTRIMFNWVNDNSDDKDSMYILTKKDFLASFSDLIEQYLKLNFSGTKENKLHLIKIVSKLHMQKELLELASAETNLEDIQKAGKRLSRKSQSAFKSK